MITIDCNLQKKNAQKFNRKIAELIQFKTSSQQSVFFKAHYSKEFDDSKLCYDV